MKFFLILFSSLEFIERVENKELKVEKGSKLGEFSSENGVSGEVYSTKEKDKILIENFSYDGKDANSYFIVNAGKKDSRTKIDKNFKGGAIVISLPPGLKRKKTRGIFVWSEKAGKSLGKVLLDFKKFSSLMQMINLIILNLPFKKFNLDLP